ncbi:hypothetical protein YC2023_066115 [Brassica napus]
MSVCVRQHTQNVCGCPSVHISARWSLDSARWPFPVDCLGNFGTWAVCSVHTGRLWVSASTHMTSVALCQHTQDVRVCPCVSVITHRTSVAVHQYTYQHASPWSQHAGSSRGLFGTSVDVHQYTYQHAGPSRGLFETSVALRHHTQDVHVCQCVSVSTQRTSVAIHQYSYQHAGSWTQHTGASRGLFGCFGPRGLSVQYTQDVRGCPSAHTGRLWVSISTPRTSVAVRVCPSAHTGCPWLSISTHISTLVLGISTLTLPVDCLGDFGQRGCLFSTHRTSVGVRQHTVCLCVSVSTHMMSVAVRVCPYVSVSTHMMSVAVHLYTYQHVGPWTQHADSSPGLFGTHISTLVLGLRTLTLPLDCLGDFGPRGLSVQYTQNVRGCPSACTGHPCLSVCLRLCPSAHRGHPWLSISTHISTLVDGLSTLAHPIDCLGDFSPHVLSVQYTQDVCGCPSAHTGRQWPSVSTHRTYVAVRVCPSAHTGRLLMSISTHINTLVLGLSTLALPVDCSGDFGPRGLSVQYTQDVRGCPPAHTRRTWLSVTTHRTSMCVCVCPTAHRGRPWLSISTHISTLVLGLSTLALPLDCSGDFGPRGLSVQYTQDVRGCPSAHPGRPWVSYTQDVRGCPSAHSTSVCVRQHTQDVCGCPCVSVCVRHHIECPWLSISTHIRTLVLGLCMLTLPLDCSGDFSPPGLSVQYTQDVCGCPPAYTGRLWLSVCVRRCPSAHTGCPWLSISTHISTLVLGFSTLALPINCLGDFSPHGLSVQYTQDVCWCPPAHTGHLWLSVSTHRTSVDVCVCLCVFVGVCQYTQDVRGCPWLSVSTHKTFVCVRQHTQDVRVCPCVSDSTHRTSMAVHLYTYQHAGPWTQHAGPSRGLFGTSVAVCGCPLAHTGRLWLSVCVRVCPSAHTGHPWLSIRTHISMLALPVDCSGDFGPRGLSVLYTQDVRGCPSACTVRPCVSVSTNSMSVAVRVCPCVSVSTHMTSVAVHQYTFQHDIRGCPPAHTGRPWLSVRVRVCSSVSISTHKTSVAVHQYTYQHVGPWTQHADPSRGLFGMSVCVSQHTHEVHGCLCVTVCVPAHIERPWLSISTHISTLDVRVCPCVSVITHRTSVAVHQYTYQHASPWSQHAGSSRGLFGTSVDVHQYTYQHAGPSRGLFGTSEALHHHTQDVHVCQCVSVSTQRTSVAIHQYSYQHAGSWTQHTGASRGLFGCFGPRGLSVQYTQDVRGCPSAHTGRLWVSISTPRTSVAVRVCPSAHTGCLWLSISTHISTLVLGISTLTLPVDCLGDFGQRGCLFSTHRTSVGVRQHTVCLCVRQHTHDVCGCPTLVLGLSMLTLPLDCSGDFSPRGLSIQYTQDVRWCPPAYTRRLWLSISTHISTLVLGLRTLTLPLDCLGDFGPRGLSVQYTQDVRGCPSACTGRPWLSVCLRLCPSAHRGHPLLSISTHISTLVDGLSTLAHPIDCLGDFSPHVLSIQYTQDVCGCPSAHTGRQWPSVSTHRTYVAVRVCPSAHTGRPLMSISTHINTLILGLSTLALPVDCSGDFGPRGLSVQYTQDVRGCPPEHTGRPWLSVTTHRTSMCVCVCPTGHRGRPWLSISTHISTLVLGLSTLALPVDCSGDFGPRGLSVQYTQDVRACPSAHTGHLWLSVCVCVCPSAHTGRPWLSISTHISTLVLGISPLTLPVDCLGDFGPRGCLFSTHRTSVGVHQHAQYIRVCPSAQTACPTHISTLVLGLSMMTLPVDCSGDFGPLGLSVKYTQDIRGCPPAHTGRPWLSVRVRVCSSVSISTHNTSVAVHQYTYQHVGPWTQHADPSRGLFG